MIEQIRAVLPNAAKSLQFEDLHSEVEFRETAVQFKFIEMQPCEVKRCSWRIMQDEHRLEQRRMTDAAFRPQLFNELLERNILMRDRIDSRVAHTVKQSAERRIAA